MNRYLDWLCQHRLLWHLQFFLPAMLLVWVVLWLG
jgi:hypothetical protein